MSPDVFVDADRGDPVEPRRVIDEATSTLSQDRGVRGVPGHPQARRRTRHGQVIDHDPRQRPGQPAAGDLRPPHRRPSRVLPPRPCAVFAPVATHPHEQRRGPVPERLMRQPSSHRVTRDALGAAPPAPRIRIHHPALDHRPIRLKALPDSLEAELVESAERGQVRGREGSVEHVEVFRMGSVRTSILEDLDAYPANATRTPTTPSTAKSRFSMRAAFTGDDLRTLDAWNEHRVIWREMGVRSRSVDARLTR